MSHIFSPYHHYHDRFKYLLNHLYLDRFTCFEEVERHACDETRGIEPITTKEMPEGRMDK